MGPRRRTYRVRHRHSPTGLRPPPRPEDPPHGQPDQGHFPAEAAWSPPDQSRRTGKFRTGHAGDPRQDHRCRDRCRPRPHRVRSARSRVQRRQGVRSECGGRSGPRPEGDSRRTVPPGLSADRQIQHAMRRVRPRVHHRPVDQRGGHGSRPYPDSPRREEDQLLRHLVGHRPRCGLPQPLRQPRGPHAAGLRHAPCLQHEGHERGPRHRR